MISKFKEISPQNVLIVIGLIYGVCFLIITPPFQVPDEQTHFYKALYLSEGNIIPEKLGNESGVYVPESAQTTVNKFNFLIFHPENKLKPDYISHLLYLPLNSNNKTFVSFSTVAIISYPPTPYLASGLGIALGQIFNLSPLLLMYIGRLMNLLVFILVIYLAIKITPIHKWVFLALALMPMAIFQGSSLSADGLTIALSFLVIAVFFKHAFDNKNIINNIDIYIIFLLILILALTKQPYFLLLLLFLLVPVRKFSSRNKMVLIFCLLFLSTILVGGTWNLLMGGFYVTHPNVSIQGQLSFILSHPLQFILALINTFIYGDKMFYLSTFVGNLGFADTPLPGWLIYSYMLFLVLISILDKNSITITKKQKLISLMTLFLIFIATCGLLYLSWTPVGKNSILGISSRYFIPIAPLFFFLFYNQKIKIRNKFNLVFVFFVLFSLSVALIMLIKRFYIF